MSKLKSAIIFLAGAVAGGAGVWYFLSSIYEERMSQDISSIKEAFQGREKFLEEKIKSLEKQTTDPNKSNQENSQEDNSDVSEHSKNRYQSVLEQTLPNRKKNAEAYLSTNVESRIKDPERPYVIKPEEFGELEDEGYGICTLYFYADGVLADDQAVVIDNIEEIIGDALDHMGEYEEDAVYCRSDAKRCDYEVLLDSELYENVRKRYPPNL